MSTETKTVATTLTHKLSRLLAVLVCVAFATGCAITPRHGLSPHDILKGSAHNLARTGNQISRSIGHDADLVLSHGYGKRHGSRHGRYGNRGRVSVHGYGHGGPIAGIIAGTVLVAVLIAAAASGGDHDHDHD